MSENKGLSVLIDTTFLITLYNKDRNNHGIAKKYFKHFIKKEIKMYLSTIVISEYQQMQPITEIISSGNYLVLPYNYEDAIKTAEIVFHLGGASRKSSHRAQFKDDLKLMGQAAYKGIDFIITEDESTLARYCKKLNDARLFNPKVILLKDGFDTSVFNSGQSSLLDKN